MVMVLNSLAARAPTAADTAAIATGPRRTGSIRPNTGGAKTPAFGTPGHDPAATEALLAVHGLQAGPSSVACIHAAMDWLLNFAVAPDLESSVWVPLADLWQAIRTTDSSSGPRRGLVRVRQI